MPFIGSVSTVCSGCYNRHIKTGYAHLIKPVQFGQTIGNTVMNIVEQGLVHFKTEIPESRKLREVWVTHHLHLTDEESKCVELLQLYSFTWHQLLMIRMNERLTFKMKCINELAGEVNHKLSTPLDLTAINKLYDDTKVKNELRKKERNAAREAFLLESMNENNAAIAELNKRAKEIKALAKQLENDRVKLSYNIGNFDIHLQFDKNDQIVASDDMTDIERMSKFYSYDTNTKALTQLVSNPNDECDCCNCCNCDL